MEGSYWQANAKVNKLKARNAQSESNAQKGFWTPQQN